MKLALGTVQFGLPYGIANTSGQVSPEEVAKILDIARAHDIDTIDTAIAYGNSESVLGDVGVADFKVVSKLPPVELEKENIRAWLFGHLEGSLSRLKLKRLDALMFHRASDYSGPHERELRDYLEEAKDRGLVSKVGVSLYAPLDLDPIEEIGAIDIVQAPFNIFDQRLKTSGWMEKLQNSGIEIHSRSTFLQGLLLLPSHRRPVKFSKWRGVWSVWDEWLANQSQSALSMCLAFVSQNPAVHRMVVGIDSSDQLKEIIEANDTPSIAFPEELVCNDEQLINPANWP